MRLAISLFALAMLSPLHGEEKPDEVVVDVLPNKRVKFDPAAIYRQDQEVLQGVFGTSQADSIAGMDLLSSNQILIAGKVGAPTQIPAAIPRETLKGLSGGGPAFLAVFDPTFRTLERLIYLPPDKPNLGTLCIGKDGSVYLGGGFAGSGSFVLKLNPTLTEVIWTAKLPGTGVSSLVVMADNSVVVMTEGDGPFLSRIKPDGVGLIPFGSQERFRYDRANPDVNQKYWIDLGYQEKGLLDQGFMRGGISDLGLTPDGNLVLLACHSIRIPGVGPDFDAMLLKFTPAGEVLWAKNLAEGIPNEPDNKYPRLYVDPYSGDLILSLTQHGAFQKGHNLAVTPGCYLTTDEWFTGDLFLGWIGRVDSETGEIKAATMYFPDLRKPKRAGKSFAGSLFPEALRTDKAGRIYVIGTTAYKLATTKHAFQPESLGGSGFLSVFDSGLTQLLYANLITAKGLATSPKHLLISELGPIVSTEVTPQQEPLRQLVTTNTDKTNFLKPVATGEVDVLFSLLPSKAWFMERED